MLMKYKDLDSIKIGIIGVGMVGGCLQRYFQQVRSIDTFLYDKGKDLGSPEEVNKAKIVFIAVPTPFKENEGGFDLSNVKEACELLDGEKIVVIKSTVVPGTTKKLQEQYPQHYFLFNPEFLVERRAYEDFTHPDRQIIGYTDKSKNAADAVLWTLPEAPVNKKIDSTAAELVKYFANTFLATKVIFANQIYNLCKELGSNYREVLEMTTADKRIGKTHFNVFQGGERGYNGKCLPKDMKALIQFADRKNVDLKLHKIVDKINQNLLEK